MPKNKLDIEKRTTQRGDTCVRHTEAPCPQLSPLELHQCTPALPKLAEILCKEIKQSDAFQEWVWQSATREQRLPSPIPMADLTH